jgi:preprotein translocase subunit SecE
VAFRPAGKIEFAFRAPLIIRQRLWRVAFGFRALIFWRCLFLAYRSLERHVTRGRDCCESARLQATVKWTAHQKMTNPLEFLQEVRAEGAKVTWPTRRETLITTGLVLFMVLLASLFFVAVDWALRLIVTGILSLGH